MNSSTNDNDDLETDITAEEDKTIATYISPADVHVAFVKLEVRLNFLIKLCQHLPALSGSLRAEAHHFRTDLTAFGACVKDCEPKTEALHFAKGRKSWAEKVDKVAAFLRQLKMLKVADEEELNGFASDLQRFAIIKLYIGHLCDKAHREDDGLIKTLVNKTKMLNLKLKKNCLKTSKEFEKLVKFLHALNSDVGKLHFCKGDDETCVICEEDMTSPVELECKHSGCADCLREYFEDKEVNAEWGCPQCGETVPKNTRFETSEAAAESLALHQHFKRNLNKFFLEVLQRFVFEGGRNPDRLVVQMLMSFVVTKELPKDDKTHDGRTKQISPFAGHCIDPTPVIRSFILQLLLHGEGFKMAEESLNLYLERERRFFLGRNEAEVTELLLLITYCLEDRLHADQEFAELDMKRLVTMGAAQRLLREVKVDNRRFGGQQRGSDLLSVAKARIALTTAAAILYEVINNRGNLDEKSFKFLGETRKMLEGNPVLSLQMRKFLVRTLVFSYRKGVIAEWRTNDVADLDLFHDLMPRELLEAAAPEARQDNFLVTGPGYKTARDQLRLSLALNQFEDLLKLLKSGRISAVDWILALHRVQDENAKPEKTASLLDQMRNDRNLKDYFEAADKILTRKSPVKAAFIVANNNGTRLAIINLLQHLQTSFWIRRTDNRVIDVLMNIAKKADSARFYPTMPQDENVETMNAARNPNGAGVTKYFECRNGHVYGIGDCGQPKGRGTCPTCAAPIGAGAQKYSKLRLIEPPLVVPICV